MYEKLERKFGRYAIRNLTTYVIFTYILGYLLEMISPQLISYMTLIPEYVMKGQVWRIVTWLLIPPTSLSIFTIIMLFFYYSIGKALENAMGDFAYNLYIFSGIIITILTTFLMYFIAPLLHFRYYGSPTTYYLAMSVYLAFAVTYPEMRVYLFFILPVKIKWLAWIYAAMLILALYNGSASVRIMIISSLANFLIFLLTGRKTRHIRPSEIKRKKQFQSQTRQSPNITRHKCAVCGRTERDGDLTFRFCSKCNGNYEYCSDHIYTHTHVQ